MIRGLNLPRLALAVLLLSAGARAQGVNTIALTADQDGQIAVSEALPFDFLIFNAQYTLNNFTSGTAHVELDFCDPVDPDFLSLISGGTSAALPATVCKDGHGQANARRVSSPAILSTGTSTGITGKFSVKEIAVYGIVEDGTIWSIPARVVLDGP